MKPFPPLPEGHPATKRACAACKEQFKQGDVTVLGNLQPADDEQAAKKANGGAYNAAGDLIHERCA